MVVGFGSADRMKRLNMFNLLKNKRGATAIEYGLIAAFIAIAAIAGITALGGKLSQSLNNTAAAFG